MSGESAEQTLEFMVLRIKRKIQEGTINFDKKLKYLKFLSHADISFDLLKKTSIGKTINSLRKEDGVIGEKAKELIIKWKDIASNNKHTSSVGNIIITEKSNPENNKIIQNNIKNENHSSSSSSSLKSDKLRSESNIKTNNYYGNKIPHKDMCNNDEFHSPNNSNDSNIHHKNPTDINKINSNKSSTSKIKSESASPLKYKVEKPIPIKPQVEYNVESNNEDSENENDDDETNQKQKASFGDMLMMPMLNLKKRKKKIDVTQAQIKRSKISMPVLPEIDLPDLSTNQVYRPSRPPATQYLSQQNSTVNVKGKNNRSKLGETPNLQEIVSRKTKSVMYTGKKNTSGIVTSLHQQAMRVLIENVDSLYDTGGVPFTILKPLLSKCTPIQLERLEEYNPHFIADEESDELWKQHCQREFKGSKPREIEQWRELHKRLCDEREVRLRRLTSKVTAHHATKVPERSVKLAYVAGAPKININIKHKHNRIDTGMNIKARRKAELKEKMERVQRSEAVAIPFSKVPRRDRCSVRPPSSLSHGGSFKLPEQRKKTAELGTKGPSSIMSNGPRKPAKKPMMAAALKLMKKQKGRINSQIVRR